MSQLTYNMHFRAHWCTDLDFLLLGEKIQTNFDLRTQLEFS